jgi:hypothetical protein
MRNHSTKIFFFACLLAAVIIQGCGRGGGGGGQAPTSQPTMAKVSVSPPTGTVNKGDTITRTVEVQNVGNTFYVAFDLTYDPQVIAYVDVEEGSFLSRNEPDSTNLQAALENGTQGKIVFGLTRLGGGEVSGSGTLLTLHFRAVGSGTTSISLSTPKKFMNGANPSQEVSIDSWEDGTITVQ